MALEISCQTDLFKAEGCPLLVLPFWEGAEPASDLSGLTLWQKQLDPVLASGDFKGKAGEVLLIYPNQGRFLLLGLGKKETAGAETIRRSYSAAVRKAQAKKISEIHLLCPQVHSLDRNALLRAVADGVFLTNYAFTYLKGESLKDNPVVLLKKVVFVGCKENETELLKRFSTIASGVHLVRELVNGNADEVTPEMLAQTARSIEKRSRNLKLKVLEKMQIEKEKMGLLLAVNRGSDLEPRLIILSYRGNPKSDDHVVLVGKGITYDTGGLSLKPTDSMLTMKCDMAGAATVLGTVQTAAALELSVNVTAVVPATENSIGAKSYKVGDVYRAMNGKTVEVTNTDAEGRLVLADAMAYALRHLDPSVIIDIASLTGAIVIALGEDLSGLFCNSDSLASELMKSSDAVNEPLWRMPLVLDYKEMLKSEVADMINSAGRVGSSITAALFLQEFCGTVPWAHIDFAGSCFPTKPKYYNTTKGTGFALRLLIDFLERRQG